MKKQINIFLILIVIVLSISLISAGMDWDNRKGVSDTFGKANYPNIEIKNTFGLGKTLWKGTLDRNTDTCGINCEAITIIELTEKGSLIDDVMFETILDDSIEQNKILEERDDYVEDLNADLNSDDIKYEEVE